MVVMPATSGMVSPARVSLFRYEQGSAGGGSPDLTIEVGAFL